MNSLWWRLIETPGLFSSIGKLKSTLWQAGRKTFVIFLWLTGSTLFIYVYLSAINTPFPIFVLVYFTRSTSHIFFAIISINMSTFSISSICFTFYSSKIRFCFPPVTFNKHFSFFLQSPLRGAFYLLIFWLPLAKKTADVIPFIFMDFLYLQSTLATTPTVDRRSPSRCRRTCSRWRCFQPQGPSTRHCSAISPSGHRQTPGCAWPSIDCTSWTVGSPCTSTTDRLLPIKNG